MTKAVSPGSSESVILTSRSCGSQATKHIVAIDSINRFLIYIIFSIILIHKPADVTYQRTSYIPNEKPLDRLEDTSLVEL